MTDATALTCYNFDNSDRLSAVSETAESIASRHDSGEASNDAECDTG
jgi:hypothetical protein